MTAEPDPYNVLGVLPTIDDAALVAVYRALLKKYHPDVYDGSKAEAELRTRAIIRAYGVLSDPDQRKSYDATRPTRAQRATEARGYTNDFPIDWQAIKTASPKARSKARTCITAALIGVLVLALAWLGDRGGAP